MDAITMLTQQHAKLRTSFLAFDEAQSPSEKAAVFEDIADQLSAHTTIEERLFYPKAYAGEPEQLLADALEQHQELKRRLVGLMNMSVGTEGFTERLQTLRDLVEQHVAEEEADLFPRVRASMGAEQLREIWVKMEVLFTREVLEGPRRNLPESDRPSAW